MNRRQLLRFIPLLAAPASLAVAETKTPPEPSVWEEMTCQGEMSEEITPPYWTLADGRCKEVLGYFRTSEYDGATFHEGTYRVTWRCGQTFRFVHGTVPVCPKCGRTQNVCEPGLREKILGIPVDRTA